MIQVASIKHKKIKIVHIAQSAGGVAEYLKILFRNMKADDYENVIIVSNDYKNQEEILEKYGKVYHVDMIRKISAKKDLKAIWPIRKILKKEQPDIVYLHSSKAGALGRIALFFNRKIKVIYNPHGWYFNADISNKKKLFIQWIEKILAYRANNIIAISESEYQSALKKHICSEKKLVLIENGIDIEKFKDYNKYREITRKKFGINNQDTVVGIVGRISEQKDPITTIKAANKIINEKHNTYFMFVGNGELEKKVRQYAKDNNIENNIIFTGWVDNVKEYIAAFDIALLPSKWEGFGLGILEYMICKKPIITTQIGGIANILNTKDSAFFIRKENPDDIVNQIKKIQQATNINQIVEKNYNRCKEHFSANRVAMQTEKLFNSYQINERRKDKNL